MRKMTPAELTAELRSYSGIRAKWVFEEGENVAEYLQIQAENFLSRTILNDEKFYLLRMSTEDAQHGFPRIWLGFKALRVERTPHSTRTRALLHFYNRGKTPIYTIEFLRKGKS